MRLVITGGPRTGKTTQALELGRAHGWPVYHTDDTMTLPWSEASAEVARWFERPGPWIIEGVAIPRALRKYLRAREDLPADELLLMTHAFVPLSPGQQRMGAGVETVLAEILQDLEQRGMVIR